jgi:hypothetical protein
LTEDEIERRKAETAAREEFLKRNEGKLWLALFGTVVAIATLLWYLTQ